MTEKRILTPEEITLAAELYAAGKGIEPIARQLKCGRQLVYNALKASGVEMKRGPRPVDQAPRDPVSAYDIGMVPRGHPLYEIDQQILRARSRRVRANGWPGRSSIAMD